MISIKYEYLKPYNYVQRVTIIVYKSCLFKGYHGN